ncbi:hypothetical protein [Shewanella sp. KJ2020]|uniref:hypothetical protein n=1 Tax=Shewanella sp. KJ2020 TaxID=2919172 RepID=UPI0020A7D2F6|nr:hypothetical protein [Shewanella sp. KJ2020]MCP3129761.1 hypothetical protein [Shewanella sp. KJ2020]
MVPNSWQISVVGNTNTDRALARKYVIRKSAKVCRQAGYRYLSCTREQTDLGTVDQFGVGATANKDIQWGVDGE